MARVNEQATTGGIASTAQEILNSNAIIRKPHWQAQYPIERISAQAYEKLLTIGQEIFPDKIAKNFKVILRVFEAYLAVTHQSLSLTGRTFTPASVLVEFVGAIYSGRFILGSLKKRYTWVARWRSVLAVACPRAYRQIPAPHTTQPPLWFAKARARFEAISLDPVQVALWHGWACLNGGNQIKWYDFRQLYLRYGKDFADGFAAACTKFYAGRRAQELPLAQAFANYLGSLPNDWEREWFLSPTRGAGLFAKFLTHQAKEFAKRDCQYTTFRDKWLDFSFFARKYLCDGKLFAKRVNIAVLPTKKVDGAVTHRKVNPDGTTVVTKLLTDVPLHLSHKAATDLVFRNILADVDSVRHWAEHEVESIWKCYQQRKLLSLHGKVKQVLKTNKATGRTKLLSRSEADWEANACATFEHYGFRPSREGHLKSLYPHPLRGLARNTLALPIKGALIPHMALLVINHPELTDGFFHELKLYDATGQLAGVGPTDVGWVLDGDKFRRGPEDSEQHVHLSEFDSAIIAQVIELTRPLRDYLKSRNDPAWQHLFLHCGKGFSYPRRVDPTDETSFRRRDRRLAGSFLASGKVSEGDVERLAARFSLTALRASVGICRYLKEPNVKKLAELLGHKTLNMRLLQRYLPPALLAFFQERWIRLFHCGLLLEALKDSPYLLSAVAFSSLDEVTEFLSHHALKWNSRATPVKQKVSAAIGHFEDKVIFSVSTENLAILESIRVQAESIPEGQLSQLARLWRDFAVRLFTYIDHSHPPRDDYKEMLSAARAQASVSLVDRGALYA